MTPRPGPVCVFVCSSFLAGSGGPASQARSGAPHLFLWPLCLSPLPGPLQSEVAPFLFLCLPLFFCCVLPFVRLCCLLLSLVSGPGCLGPRRSGVPSTPPPVLCFSSLLLRCVPPCLWLCLVSGTGCPGPWRCVLFVLLVRRFSGLRALSLPLCFLPGRSLLPGGCCPPPPRPPPSPFVSCGFRRRRSVPFCFFLPALLLPAGSALVGGSRRLPPPLSCLSCWSPASWLPVCSCCVSCFPPGRWLLPGGCCPPPPPSVSCGFRRCRAVLRFLFFSFFFHCCYALACLLGARRRFSLSTAPLHPPPAVCFVGLPLLSSPCALAAVVFTACPLAAPWWLLPPPPPFCVSRFSSLPLGAPFFFFLCCVAPAWLLGARRRLSPSAAPPPHPGACVVPCAVWCCRAVLPLRRVFCGAVLPCSACSRFGLLSFCGLCCRVLCCAVCPWVQCCATLLRVVLPGVLLLCDVLFCCARWVPLLVVQCPRALPVALGPCALRRCVLRCSPALCALCCVCFVVACWCVLLFPAVLCAVCVLGCHAVHSLSSPLCALLCFTLLVRLRCAVREVPAVASAWCCGALLCVVLFSFGLPSCIAGSGGPWLSAGGVFRCRCPCRAAWSASPWLVRFAVVPCFPVSCSVLLCCRVVLCCRALLLFCGAVGVCFALLWPVVRRCAVLCCVVGGLWRFLPGGGVCVLWCSFPPCRHAQRTLIITPCYPVPVSVSVVHVVGESGLA